jgi:hypothetical protein
MKIQFDSQADALYLRRLGRSRNAPPDKALMRYAGANASYLAAFAKKFKIKP